MSDSVSSLFLVGLMGAGKTTLGKMLAESLSVPFVDTDEEIVVRCGADIPWIFDVEGESGFRERETAVLRDYISVDAIVSTGGGIVTMPENRDLLKQSGRVVYLRVEPERLFARIGKDKRRPLLQTADPLSALKGLFDVRDPLYREVATDILDAGSQSPKEMLNKLLKIVQQSPTC
jgi:shikimate kinase